MLFYTKNDINMFDRISGGKVNGNYMYLNSSASAAIKKFPSELNDFWLSVKGYNNVKTAPLQFNIVVNCENGSTCNISFKSNSNVLMPTGNNTTLETKFTKNLPLLYVWHTYRIHCWISNEPSTLHFSAYLDGQPMVDNMESIATSTGFSSFAELNFQCSSYADQYYFKDIIISDKFFGESAIIKEIPINKINNWNCDSDTGFYHTSQLNHEGTLVIDSLSLADLERYNVISTAISGKVTREGEDIKAVEFSIGNKKVSAEVNYGLTPFSVDIGNDLSTLSNITIKTKG